MTFGRWLATNRLKYRLTEQNSTDRPVTEVGNQMTFGRSLLVGWLGRRSLAGWLSGWLLIQCFHRNAAQYCWKTAPRRTGQRQGAQGRGHSPSLIAAFLALPAQANAASTRDHAEGVVAMAPTSIVHGSAMRPTPLVRRIDVAVSPDLSA